MVAKDASRSLENGSREAQAIVLCSAILKYRLVMTILFDRPAQPALLLGSCLQHHVGE
ncbi:MULTISPECIES: hypothetical protein [Bradyrhizobium]|uniref:hypothetical protein n=1 Tax=Bradyrhizobium TaxID=374 RepID=UPI00137483DE|nr:MULTISPECIES: hypothetical protein [Bradyrhizobium]WOH56915.1 hypothetical protein RX329_32420 [Bradyrhizobium sp. BWC-3-1]